MLPIRILILIPVRILVLISILIRILVLISILIRILVLIWILVLVPILVPIPKKLLVKAEQFLRAKAVWRLGAMPMRKLRAKFMETAQFLQAKAAQSTLAMTMLTQGLRAKFMETAQVLQAKAAQSTLAMTMLTQGLRAFSYVVRFYY